MQKERKSARKARIRTGAVASLTAAAMLFSAAPTQAHVSITPVINVKTDGNVVRDAVSIGKTGYLNFRIGHGCMYGATTDVNPLTGLSLEGTSYGTHQFKVTIPYAAAINTTANSGTAWTYGLLKAPKPGYKPGWTSSVTLNQGAIADAALPTDQTTYSAYLATVVDDSYTITWTANSAEFDVPAYDSNDLTTPYAEFGASVSWAKTDQDITLDSGTGTSSVGNISSGSTQYFAASQVCKAKVEKKPAKASKSVVSLKKLSSGKVSVSINAASTQKNKVVTLSADGSALATSKAIKLNKNGDAVVTLTGAAATAALTKGALISVNAGGTQLGYKLGSATKTTTLSIDWNQKLASGAVAVETNNGRTESNQAPSVKVFTAQ